MGFWGPGPYDNDYVLDWMAVVKERGLVEVQERLEVAQEDIEDWYDAAIVVGACELVARALGSPGERNVYSVDADVWADQQEFLQVLPLLDPAVRALRRLLDSADLSAFRSETARDGWLRGIEKLQTRLNQLQIAHG
jgi:hypothetical protein